MNIVFIDSETNGLPKNWKAKVTDLDNWPRCIQFAWQVASVEGSVLVDHKFLIKPDGWKIPDEKFWIDNGFFNAVSEKEGHPLPDVLNLFLKQLEYYKVTHGVAHNMAFDSKIIGAEMIRYKLTFPRKLTTFCTMELSTDLCQLPGPYGYKWPKLIELHNILFGSDFHGAHDSGNDVTACRVCFFELLKRGVIELPDKVSIT